MEQQHQHRVDGQDADRHRRQEAGKQLLHAFRVTRLAAFHAFGQMRQRRQLIHSFQHVAQRLAAEVGANRHVTTAVVALDALRTRPE